VGEAVRTYRPHRQGVHATVNGVTYPARYNSSKQKVFMSLSGDGNPDPALFSWNELHGLWVAEVPAAECERVVSISPYARFHGHRCAVETLDPDGSAEIIYTDQDWSWAERNGFDQHDRGTYRRQATAAELYDYHEEQADLLFEQWRTANFEDPR
jgi:hypothetical protein